LAEFGHEGAGNFDFGVAAQLRVALHQPDERGEFLELHRDGSREKIERDVHNLHSGQGQLAGDRTRQPIVIQLQIIEIG
jgi:endonuclease I